MCNMVSNGYSARRVFLRRPKVCKTSPNPGRCHPPPPPPPSWPPDTFELRWTCAYTGMMGVEEFDEYIWLTRLGTSHIWEGDLIVGPYTYEATWTCNFAADEAALLLHRSGGFMPIDCEKGRIPFTPGTPTEYAILDWDSKSGWITYCRAIFTF